MRRKRHDFRLELGHCGLCEYSPAQEAQKEFPELFDGDGLATAAYASRDDLVLRYGARCQELAQEARKPCVVFEVCCPGFVVSLCEDHLEELGRLCQEFLDSEGRRGESSC